MGQWCQAGSRRKSSRQRVLRHTLATVAECLSLSDPDCDDKVNVTEAAAHVVREGEGNRGEDGATKAAAATTGLLLKLSGP